MSNYYHYYSALIFIATRNQNCGFPLTATNNGPTPSETLTDAMVCMKGNVDVARLSVCDQLYLMKYGYMDGPGPANINSTRSAPLLSPDGLQDYVRNFQGFAGLPLTGELDLQTADFMKLPR